MTGLREHLLVVLLFLVLAFIFTVPFALHAQDTVIGGHVDNLLNVWILSWDGHAVATDPAGLFQANIDYPSRDSLAFSEHLFVLALIAAPIAWITGNPVFAYNFILLVGFALCGYTMYLLAKYLTGNRPAAVAAGVFFTFVPYHFSTIVHVHVSLYLLQPLILLFLFRYFDQGRPRHLVGFGVSFLAQALLGWYQLAFSSIPIALFLLWQLLSRRRREKARLFLPVVGVLVLCMALVIPFAIPYFRVHRDMPEKEREPAVNVILRATLRDYVRVLPQNFLYHKLGIFKTGNPGEGNALFPGFLVFPLSILALACVFSRSGGRRKDEAESAAAGSPDVAGGREPLEGPLEREGEVPRGERPPPPRTPPSQAGPPPSYFAFFVALGLVCFVLSLGPNPHGMSNIFYKALHKLPIYGFVRFPIRYHIMVILSLSVVIAYACTYVYRYLERRKNRTWGMAAVAALGLLLLLEFSVANLPYTGVAVGGAVPQVYRDLEKREGAVVVVEAPMPYVDNSVVFEDPLTLNFGTLENTFLSAWLEQDAIYFSVYHWKKLLNGMSGYYPLFYRRAMVEMQAFPSPRTLAFLQGAGVDHIVLHWDRYPEEGRAQVRESLQGEPGVNLVEDYPDGISLYRLDARGTVSVGALALSLHLPARTGPGLPLHASLAFANHDAEAFVNTVEERQRLRIEWRDSTGGTVREEESYCYVPFFIAPGEGAVAPFQAAAPAQNGRYILHVTAVDGLLSGMAWSEEVRVEEVASVDSGEAIGGELSWPEGEGGKDLGFRPGEVFSLEMRADNSGSTRWEREREGVRGSVGVTALWTREGDPEYEMYQQGMLPCDLAPGQGVAFPVTLQAPREEGSYALRLRLNCLGVEYFGPAVTLAVTVGR